MFAAVTLCDLTAIAQAPRPAASLVAFRVDDRHAVAVIAEVADQPDSVDGPQPIALTPERFVPTGISYSYGC